MPRIPVFEVIEAKLNEERIVSPDHFGLNNQPNSAVCMTGTAENSYRTFPLASEANMPPKERMAKIMKDVCMLSWKRG